MNFCVYIAAKNGDSSRAWRCVTVCNSWGAWSDP